ncbi:MAG TPA: hypothetical protein VII11_00325, partial [Bacteroidota bacterium]
GIGTRSRALYTLAERGPEYVSPMSAASAAANAARINGADTSFANEVGAMRRAIENGQWRMRGADMVYVVDKNKNILNKRSL